MYQIPEIMRHDFVVMVVLGNVLFAGYVVSLCPAKSYQHTKYTNLCFTIDPNVSEIKGRDSTRAHCIANNAIVMEIYNHVIEQFIADTINRLFQCGGFDEAYVGMNETTGWWYSGRPATYQKWKDGKKSPGNSQKDCVMVNNDYKLMFKQCGKGTKPICQSIDPNNTLHVALVDGTSETNGRVEIFRAGIWGPVCSHTEPKISDLSGVCTMLGFKPVRVLAKHEVQAATGYVTSEGLNCTENARTLADCIVSNMSTISCTLADSIGLQCEYLTYNDSCPVLYTGLDPCPTDALVCTTEQRCLCNESHYWNGTACFPRQSFNGPCMDPPYGGNPCLLDLICTDGVCKCISGKYWNASTVQCEINLTYNDSCPALHTGLDPCPPGALTCTTVKRCLCIESHYWNGTECFPRQSFNGPCMDPPYGGNPCLLDLICTDGVCKCIKGKYWNASTVQCEIKPFIPVILDVIKVAKKKQLTSASDERKSAKVMGMTICVTIFTFLGMVILYLDCAPGYRSGTQPEKQLGERTRRNINNYHSGEELAETELENKKRISPGNKADVDIELTTRG